MYKTLSITLVLLLSSFFTWSQIENVKPTFSGTLNGIILDSLENTPIEYAQVRLYSKKDSLLVTSIYTEANGSFTLDKIPLGMYYSKITFLGFKTKFISNLNFTPNALVLNLAKIQLSLEDAKNLGEVKITGKLDVLKTGIDKKIYNVADDASSRGGNANDVLNRVPSVGVDQDGNISLRGDGNVTILIDGRPSSFSGGNGKSLLDAIPASSIERIEIVTNPSSKYSPDGTAGIINVVLKKNKLKGTNGLISSSVATDKLFNGNASFSYRNAKFNVYANYTYKYSEGYRNNYGNLKQIFTADSSSLFVQDRIGTDFNASHTLRAGADFYLKPNQTLGFSITGSDGERNRTGNLKNKMYFNETTLTRNWERLSDDPSAQQNMDISLNYKIDLKDNKGTLTADIAQSLGTDDISGKYDETYYNLDGTISTLPTLHQSIVNFEKNNVSNAQMDYTRVYPEKGARIEMGVKSIVRNLGVNTVSKTLDNETQIYEVDSVANFVYEYNEQIYGAYAIYGRQIGKFKFQGGLRAEQAFQSPFLISTGEKFTNNYFQIYPSGHLKYNHKTNTEWSLSYSRRINRASSSDMNPFSSYADPYNLRKGNPNLKPEYINSIDVGYSVELPKVTLTTSVYARQTTDVIQRVKIFYPDNTSAITFANIDQSQSVGIELVATFKPVRWWKNVISFNGNGIQYKDNTAGFNYNNSGFTWGAKYIGSVDFWKKTMVAVLNVNYVAPFVSAQGTGQRRGAVDVSTEKTFKGGKWAAGLRVTDIFNRQGFSLNLTQPSIEQNAEFKWLTRRLYFTLTYKFGKLEMSNKKPASEGGGGQDF